MKPVIPVLALLAVVLAGGSAWPARAARTPGPAEYGAFSGFVSGRNIFNPNRSWAGGLTSRPAPTPAKPAGAFTYTGSLSYEKGAFAVFDGNQPGLRQVLTVRQQIAGYTIAEISLAGVKLVSADRKSRELMTGEAMREVGGHWEKISPAEPSGTSTPATLTPDSAPNDILKRLMELRQKESQ